MQLDDLRCTLFSILFLAGAMLVSFRKCELKDSWKLRYAKNNHEKDNHWPIWPWLEACKQSSLKPDLSACCLPKNPINLPDSVIPADDSSRKRLWGFPLPSCLMIRGLMATWIIEDCPKICVQIVECFVCLCMFYMFHLHESFIWCKFLELAHLFHLQFKFVRSR